MPNQDEIKGKVKAFTGRVKEAIAEAAGDDVAASEGRSDQVAGETRQAVGALKRRVAETGADLKDRATAVLEAAKREKAARAKRSPV